MSKRLLGRRGHARRAGVLCSQRQCLLRGCNRASCRLRGLRLAPRSSCARPLPCLPEHSRGEEIRQGAAESRGPPSAHGLMVVVYGLVRSSFTGTVVLLPVRQGRANVRAGGRLLPSSFCLQPVHPASIPRPRDDQGQVEKPVSFAGRHPRNAMSPLTRVPVAIPQCSSSATWLSFATHFSALFSAPIRGFLRWLPAPCRPARGAA